MRILRLAIFTLATALLAQGSSAMAEARVSKGAPNIIFILVDDLDQLVTDPYLPEVMPFTTGLQKDGVRFPNSYSAVICCEARAGILTGLHPHNNGVFTNGGAFGGYAAFRAPKSRDGTRMLDDAGKPVDNETRTMARYLADAGYRTAMIGKYLNGFETKNDQVPPPPLGFTDGDVFVDPAKHMYLGYRYQTLDWQAGGAATVKQYGDTPADYQTDVVKGLALSFLERARAKDSDQPVFLYLAPTAPHLPIPPAPRHVLLAEKWIGTLPTDRPNYFSYGDTLSDKPAWLQATWEKRTNPLMRLWTQHDWHYRLGALYAVDEMVKDIYGWLEANHELDHTMIVFTSDNGYNLGAHGLIHKMAPYEESVRVPTWIYGGAALGFKKGVVDERVIEHIDHAPTFLELAGVPLPSPVDGRSLVPLLKQGAAPATPWRNALVQEYDGSFGADGIGAELPDDLRELATYYLAPAFMLDVPTHRSLKVRLGDRNLTYIEWYDDAARAHEYELFDDTRDESQLVNLVARHPSACSLLQAKLHAELMTMRACKGEACSRALPDADVASTRLAAEGCLTD